MNETALLEEVKPLLDRMAKESGKTYVTLQLSFRRQSAGEFKMDVGAYVDGFAWQYAETVKEASAKFLEGASKAWFQLANVAAEDAENARIHYEHLLRTANELRSKALAMEALPAIPSDNITSEKEAAV